MILSLQSSMEEKCYLDKLSITFTSDTRSPSFFLHETSAVMKPTEIRISPIGHLLKFIFFFCLYTHLDLTWSFIAAMVVFGRYLLYVLEYGNIFADFTKACRTKSIEKAHCTPLHIPTKSLRIFRSILYWKLFLFLSSKSGYLCEVRCEDCKRCDILTSRMLDTHKGSTSAFRQSFIQ